MKAVNGMKLSYRLQEVLQQDPSEPLRGFRMDEQCVSLNHNLYSSLRGTRNHRRALLTNMLNMFDDTQVSLLLFKLKTSRCAVHVTYKQCECCVCRKRLCESCCTWQTTLPTSRTKSWMSHCSLCTKLIFWSR